MKQLIFLIGAFISFQTRQVVAQNTYPWGSSGNVGIGTINPHTNLTIQSNVADGLISYTNASGNSKAYLGLAVTNGQMIPGSSISDLIIRTEHQKILFSTDAGTTNNLALSGDNIGIGTSSPDRRLTVAGNSGFNVRSSSDYFVNLNYLYGASTPALYALGPSGGVSNISINPEGGYVGVGTVIPKSKLHISTGNNSVTSAVTLSSDILPASTLITGGNTLNGKVGLVFAANDEGDIPAAIISNRDASTWGTDLSFHTHTPDVTALKTLTEKMRITSSGNVGIGTLNPGEKLSVNGNIRAKEVKVEIANWPDYVFEEGYELEKLEGLERFIKVNKHLPAIPSAAEVERDGINLGDMNAKLLKKIEELTLYLIKLQKGYDQLTVKFKTQQNEINQLKSKL